VRYVSSSLHLLSSGYGRFVSSRFRQISLFSRLHSGSRPVIVNEEQSDAELCGRLRAKLVDMTPRDAFQILTRRESTSSALAPRSIDCLYGYTIRSTKARAQPQLGKRQQGDSLLDQMLRHFDGSERAPRPSNAELVLGAFVEFLAMALFVFFGCGSAASNVKKVAGEWDPASVCTISLQFGLAITVLAFATAHTSGGHINCAVTLGLTIVGTCHPIRGLVYLIAQLLGSVAGAALLKATTSGSSLGGVTLDRTGGLGANGLQNASVGLGNALLKRCSGRCSSCLSSLRRP
jgi:hypothetical protein